MRHPLALSVSLGWLPVALAACGSPEDPVDTGLAVVEEGEWLPGGQTTNTLMLGSNAFLMPATNLDEETESLFYSGNSWFNQPFVEAPASTETRDGLGPLFNARTCSGCHFKDGRAGPPEQPGDDPLGSLVRLSIPGEDAHGGPLPDPVYGGQLQDLAIDGVPAEGQLLVEWEEVEGSYGDGTAYSLRRPVLGLTELAYGDPDPGLRTSLRIAPHMVGLGLLEAIPETRLAELADPDDTDGDGISGRINTTWDAERGEAATGRFGWKAEQPTVLTQTAGAFNGDMGLTSALATGDDCTAEQWECQESTSGGEPEVEEHILDRVAVYSAVVAVPVRRDWEDPTVLRGKRLFAEAGCDACHTPSHTTGDSAVAEALSDQLIWPYTDLLLHDLGEGLADERPVHGASGSEWKTPPLWGLGLVPDVNGHDRLLHDGRARGFAEAILWHGGEAEDSKEAFRTMSAEDREALVAFLSDL